MTYELFGAAAFALSSHECEAGAFHGATEAMFKSRGTANLEEDVRTICGGAGVFFFQAPVHPRRRTRTHGLDQL